MIRILKIFSEKCLFNNLSTMHTYTCQRQKSKSSKKTYNFDKNSFIMLRVTPDDYSEVTDLFSTSYMREEPSIIAAGLAYKRNAILEEMFMDSLRQGMSLMVRCRGDGSICGAAVNSACCAWDAENLEKFAQCCQCPNAAQLLKFYAYIARAPNLWERFCQTKIFEISYLTVRKQDRGKGISHELVSVSRRYAKDMGYQMVRVDATSHFTGLICEKLKMKLIHEIPYKSYLGPDGHPLYFPPPPHTSVKIFADLPCFLDKKK